ncbi:unnamed protein product [Cylindrotheca closterium]|uniref:Pyrroline-5-carboxylate reductase catalytic N-terminal domain-containing protein n=1 Tax=Cylindrotheca closterium TaxID=2856 RepID=A0AAD2JII5_9STRA|nr:unnamed protein product [Cylindrotheca closterium]
MTESSSTTALAAGSDGNPTKIGFIGCGTIAFAIATGIATQSKIKIESIAVSKRSEQKSKLLAETFPDLVTVQEENQKILDENDLIFLCVLPQLTSEILKNLKFDTKRHTLVSLASTTKLDDLVRDSKLDATRVSKMICLPSIARHQGISLHCCPTKNPFLTSLFEATGGVTTLESESGLEAAMMTTCVMGPIYGMMKHGRDWLTQHTNLSAAEASELVVKQYVGAVLEAERDCDQPNRLEDLVAEQTPGGINEQALRNMEQLGGMETQTKVMDAILSRIRGESDGSVVP